MTPEAAAFLVKARELLRDAEVMIAAELYNAAGRTAYLAGFNAAQALISERTDRSVKTHRGVRAELHRLTKDDPRFVPDLRNFLARTYQLKEVADYETGPGSHLTAAQAKEATEAGARFVAAIAASLDSS